VPPDADLNWTTEQAASYATDAGIPCTPAQLEGIIANLPGLGPSGRAPSGPQGGRGRYLYPTAVLMDLISLNARWLIPPRDIPPSVLDPLAPPGVV